MSRFETKKYQQVLQIPRMRFRLRRREEPLWKYKLTSAEKTRFVLLISLWILWIVGFYLADAYSVLPSAYLGILCLFLIFSTLIFCIIDKERKLKTNISSRKPRNLQEFIAVSPRLLKGDKVFIRAVRYALGFAYELNPDIIYATDTAQSLGALKHNPLPPLRFEVVLGTADRLGIKLTDEEIDGMGERIYKNTHTVEELAVILAEEMSTAARKIPENDARTDKKSNHNAITLDELRELADNSLARKYIFKNVCEMLKLKGEARTFKESQPLPQLEDVKPEEMPSFAEVLQKLRNIARLGVVLYRTPMQERITLEWEGQPVELQVEICDGIDEAYATLRLGE